MLEALEEMKTGSLPDKNADYYEQRDEIAKHITQLKNVESQIEGIETEF